MATLSVRHVKKTKARHCCCECGLFIPSGQESVRIVATVDGDFRNGHLHLKCWDERWSSRYPIQKKAA